MGIDKFPGPNGLLLFSGVYDMEKYLFPISVCAGGKYPKQGIALSAITYNAKLMSCNYSWLSCMTRSVIRKNLQFLSKTQVDNFLAREIYATRLQSAYQA